MFKKVCFAAAALLCIHAYGGNYLLVTLDSPPMEFVKDGKPTGFNAEIAIEAMQRLGHTATIQFVPWQRALEMVKDGSADAIIDAGFNKERAEFLYYPDENIYTEEIYAFKLKGDPTILQDNIGNAKDISIGVGRGFHYGGTIQEKLDKKEFKSIEVASDIETNIKKLMAKRYDIFLGVKQYTLYISKQMGVSEKIEFVPSASSGKPIELNASKTFIAFSKKKATQELANQVGLTLKKMKEDGTYKKIYAKYE